MHVLLILAETQNQMQYSGPFTGGGADTFLMIVLSIVGFVSWVLYIILPFYVMAINRRVRESEAHLRALNKQVHLLNEWQEYTATQMEQLNQRVAGRGASKQG